MTSGESQESVGSVGEEAAKLLSALQGWARESGSEYAGAAADVAADATSALGSINEHLATGGRDCRYCPICRLIAATRETSPEVKHHLASAATSLTHALAGVLATHVDQTPKNRADTPVEKIDLSDDEDWEDD